MDCPFCNGTRTIYAGSFMTWEGPVPHYEICEACDGRGTVETPVSSEDWTGYERVMQADADADFAEAKAGLDSWYRAQAA